MRRYTVLSLVISITSPLVASAQEPPGPPQAPPAQESPPPGWVPAPVQIPPANLAPQPEYAPQQPVYQQPVFVQPAPYGFQQAAADEESRGYSKKVAGAILMTLGFGGFVAGFVLTTMAEIQTPGSCPVHGGSGNGGFDLPGYLCTAQWIGGTVLEAVGSTVAEIGGIVYAVGGSQKRKALKMRGRLTVAPAITPSFGGARLSLAF
jgi:hypothetical protein